MGYDAKYSENCDTETLNASFKRIFNGTRRNHSDFSTCEDRHFGVKVQNKNYPSCYQYNVLIMLAKRLIEEEKLAGNNNKNCLQEKLIYRIIND